MLEKILGIVEMKILLKTAKILISCYETVNSPLTIEILQIKIYKQWEMYIQSLNAIYINERKLCSCVYLYIFYDGLKNWMKVGYSAFEAQFFNILIISQDTKKN